MSPVTEAVTQKSSDDDKNRPVNTFIVCFLENGLPEKHLVMEAGR